MLVIPQRRVGIKRFGSFLVWENASTSKNSEIDYWERLRHRTEKPKVLTSKS